MNDRFTSKTWCFRWLAVGAGLLFQQGCFTIDPDIKVNAIFQILTEAAIFFTDSAIVSMR